MSKNILNFFVLCTCILIFIPDSALIAGAKDTKDRKYVLDCVNNCSVAVDHLLNELKGYLKTTTTTPSTRTGDNTDRMKIKSNPQPKGKLSKAALNLANKLIFEKREKWIHNTDNILTDIDNILVDIDEDSSNRLNGDTLSNATRELEVLLENDPFKLSEEDAETLQTHANKTHRRLTITENTIDDKIHQANVNIGLTIVSSILVFALIIGIVLLSMKPWEKNKKNLLEMEVREHDTPPRETRGIPNDGYMSYNDRFRQPNQPTTSRSDVVRNTSRAPVASTCH